MTDPEKGPVGRWLPMIATVYALVAPAVGVYGGVQYARGQDTFREQTQESRLVALETAAATLNAGREANKLAIGALLESNKSDHDWIKRTLERMEARQR